MSLHQQIGVGFRIEGGRWEPHSLSPFPGFYPPLLPYPMDPAVLPGSWDEVPPSRLQEHTYVSAHLE